MRRIIVTDSASDISVQAEQELDIRILPFKVAIGEQTYQSRIDFDNEGFYPMLEEAKALPATSQITPFEFEELYAELFEAGYEEVILVLINSEGSATFGNACLAVDGFYETHPEAREKMTIHPPIDGRSYTAAYGYPVTEAAKMLKAGVPTGEILAYLKDYMDRSIIYAGLYTLKYAAKSGRIPSAAAFVGDAIGMKPIMRIADCAITTNDKVRGEKNIIPFIVTKTAEVIEPGAPYCVIYGNDAEAGRQLTEAAQEALGYPPADFYQIGAAIAINAGPKVVGISTLRKAVK